jgi:hypothetical protein
VVFEDVDFSGHVAEGELLGAVAEFEEGTGGQLGQRRGLHKRHIE